VHPRLVLVKFMKQFIDPCTSIRYYRLELGCTGVDPFLDTVWSMLLAGG
jgi:hypothetical protein